MFRVTAIRYVKSPFQSLPSDLKQYPILRLRPTDWGEMDAFGHINNVTYLKYFETARICHFQQMMDKVIQSHPDYPTDEFLHGTGIGPILKHTECRYKWPGTYPDDLVVGSKIEKDSITEFEFKQEYIVFSRTTERTLATGSGLIVSFDYKKGEKAPIPPEILNVLKNEDYDEKRFF